ncbi:hypothetical protein FOZ60_007902 [Perkinsus olseni]|uniref:Reverse transcriptase domain-containing protein n=1 Tax=Perkinsus olseni TaxID=32597 RepID=A0A7J6NKP2_PEROL|nr:hypothetical protein FOZ60_007902 [Perkinsus olseni]
MTPLTVEAYDGDKARKGMAPDRVDPRFPFRVEALVVDSLAYDLILGHDFMSHYGLDIQYSATPIQIVGNPPLKEPSSLPWFVEHPVQAANLKGKAESYCLSSQHTSCAATSPDNDSFDLSCPEYLVAGAGTKINVVPLTDEELREKGWPIPRSSSAPTPSATSVPPASDLVAAGMWPPPGYEDTDDLQDDPLADPLRFAVPDFRDTSIQLPEFCSSPSEEQRPVAALCEEFSDLFAVRPGFCNSASHCINTGSNSPLCERVRPLPHRWREEVSAMLQEMESLGVIRRSTSPWRFPCVFVPKKNGKVRMCIDYRGLNRLCETEAYPVPRPDDVQEHLRNAKYFTTLDLRSGYWQVPVRPEDQAKTAFCPGPGFPLYEWLRMPFGLASAPATFQRLMDSLVGDLPFVKCYLDDLLIFSSSLEEHLAHLRQVFELLRAAGLTIAAEKCAIAETSVDYLGHTFGPSGMTPDIKKVETILRWPVPGSVPELRSFLGLANYYRGFLPHFSERTRPLYELLTESIKLKTSALLPWTDTCEAAMVDVKENLARLPLLTYPDFTRPFQLITDASDVAIGGVLEQDGAPLSFFSQALTSTQRRWPVYEREAFAIFRSLERFRNLLLGYPLELIVFTDHKPLTFLETSTTPKVQRWMLSLCQYSFSIQYRPGKDNVVADALSRLPSARSDMDIEQSEPPVHPAAMLAPVCLGSGLVYQLNMETLKKEQFADSNLWWVMKKLLGERSDDRDERFSLYAARLLEFSLEDGVLMYTREVCDGRQPQAVPVIPSLLKDRMLYEAHELQGHQGLQATRRWLQSRCYWLDMEDDVRLHLYCCSKCFPSTTDSEGEEPYRPAMMATLASFVLDDSSARPVVAGNVSGVRPVIPSALVTASEEWSREDIRLRQDEDDVIRLVKERLRDQQPFGRAAMRDPLFRL